MKYFTLLILCLFGLQINAQSSIQFSYDNSGNQIERKYCYGCSAKNSNEIPKEIAELKQEDLQKFFPEDVISYYPNPVKEQLYLKWELINDVKVSSIRVFSLSGQVIKSYDNLEGKNSFVIQFSSLPQNIYSIVLVYTNGDEKPIKIIKE